MTLPKRLSSGDAGWLPDMEEKLEAAVRSYPLTETVDWEVLDSLSQNTSFEGLEVQGKLVVVDGNQLVAPGSVYVRLSYGDKEDVVSFSDSYPARVIFHVTSDGLAKTIIVDKVHIDTSSFYS